MPKEEIIAGLKYAVAKGDLLPKAMMSFYNAGYLKKDIEEAARALQSPQLLRVQQPIQPTQQPIQPQAQQPAQQPIQPKAPVVVQRVSAYEEKAKPGKALMFILVFFLILLLGILVAVFLFKDELSALLGGIL